VIQIGALGVRSRRASAAGGDVDAEGLGGAVERVQAFLVRAGAEEEVLKAWGAVRGAVGSKMGREVGTGSGLAQGLGRGEELGA
jgi:hypothetical protein